MAAAAEERLYELGTAGQLGGGALHPQLARHGQVWGDSETAQRVLRTAAALQEDHRAIVEALRARDSGSAVEAMRAHLARVQEHFNVTDPAAGVSWHSI